VCRPTIHREPYRAPFENRTTAATAHERDYANALLTEKDEWRSIREKKPKENRHSWRAFLVGRARCIKHP